MDLHRCRHVEIGLFRLFSVDSSDLAMIIKVLFRRATKRTGSDYCSSAWFRLLSIVLALFLALFCFAKTFFYILSQKALLAFFLIFD